MGTVYWNLNVLNRWQVVKSWSPRENELVSNPARRLNAGGAEQSVYRHDAVTFPYQVVYIQTFFSIMDGQLKNQRTALEAGVEGPDLLVVFREPHAVKS